MNESTSLPDLDIPILENEECWAMRVIDEHQIVQSSNLNSQFPSSETVKSQQSFPTED
jgi:hypothetical protein